MCERWGHVKRLNRACEYLGGSENSDSHFCKIGFTFGEIGIHIFGASDWAQNVKRCFPNVFDVKTSFSRYSPLFVCIFIGTHKTVRMYLRMFFGIPIPAPTISGFAPKMWNRWWIDFSKNVNPPKVQKLNKILEKTRFHIFFRKNVNRSQNPSFTCEYQFWELFTRPKRSHIPALPSCLAEQSYMDSGSARGQLLFLLDTYWKMETFVNISRTKTSTDNGHTYPWLCPEKVKFAYIKS